MKIDLRKDYDAVAGRLADRIAGHDAATQAGPGDAGIRSRW